MRITDMHTCLDCIERADMIIHSSQMTQRALTILDRFLHNISIAQHTDLQKGEPIILNRDKPLSNLQKLNSQLYNLFSLSLEL
jgi:hypothetical protein